MALTIISALICTSLSLKNIIQKMEINPYELIFVQIPEVFNANEDYRKTFSRLDEAKTLLDDYYDWIVQKAVQGTYDVFAHNKKNDLYHILKSSMLSLHLDKAFI